MIQRRAGLSPRLDATLRESVNAFLKKARASGELNQMLRRWMPKLQ